MQKAPVIPSTDSGLARFGTFKGALKSTSLDGVDGEKAFNRRKNWYYQLIVTKDVILSYAIVNLNYAANGFISVLDRNTGDAVDKSFLGLPLFTKVSITENAASGLKATLASGKTRLEAHGFGKGVRLIVDQPEVLLNASVIQNWDQALTVIAPVEDGLVNVTQKTVGAEFTGSLKVKGKSYDLTRAVSGSDYTLGYLARRTAWRWAMGLGRLDDGTPFGFNLVRGINEGPESNENAFWLGNELYTLDRADFDWNPGSLLAPWKLRTKDGKFNAEFTPKYVHSEARDLLLIKSSFAQPMGTFKGTVVLNGRTVSFTAGGVTETQDSTW